MRAFTISLLILSTTMYGDADDKSSAKVKPTAATAKATDNKKTDNKELDNKKTDKKVADQKDKPSVWMDQKLKHSQKIFAAMVEGDLFTVEDAARQLKFISRLENFVKARHKGYRTQLRAFNFANNEILEGAKEKNIDRVTLGYNQMTLSCVACHKKLRSDGQAAAKVKPAK